MSKKVLFIVSSAEKIGPNNRATGNYLPEVAHPYAEFAAKEYHIDFASIEGGEPPIDGLELTEDALNVAFLEGTGLAKMKQSARLDAVDASQYDAIFIPGGLGPMVDMPDNTLLQNTIAETYEREAVVGAVCHGPVSLLNVKLSDGTYLVKDKNITSFTNAEEEGYAKDDVPFLLETELVNHGAKFHTVSPWEAHSIADGHLVTGQNPASAQGVAQKMIALLN